MRSTGLCALAALILSSWAPGATLADSERASGTCGRADYPSATEYSDDSVLNETLWALFRAEGGFANGTTGEGALEVHVDGEGAQYVVTLTEISVRRYVGGAATLVPALSLRIQEENPIGYVRAAHNFSLVDPSHAGGALALRAWIADGDLEVFWRWSYLPCDEAFPNVYYVFHGRVQGGNVTDDNSLIYFEASRPRRGPPADLILLVTAGIAASVIFLFARRAARGPAARRADSDDRTIK